MPFQFYCPHGHLLEGQESQMGQQSQCPMCGIIFVVPIVPQVPVAGAWMPGYSQPAQAPAFQPPGFQPQTPGPLEFRPGFPGAPGFVGPACPSEIAAVHAAEGFSGQDDFAPNPSEQGPVGAAASFPSFESPPAVESSETRSEALGAAIAADEAAAPASSEGQPPAAEKQQPRIVRIACPQGHELQTPMDMIGQEVLCPFCNSQFLLLYENSVEFKEEQAELKRTREERLNRTALQWAIVTAVVVVLGIISMIVYLAMRSPAN
jgi:hypothetical protein